MKRRSFLSKTVALTALSGLNFGTLASASTSEPSPPDLTGFSQGFFEVRHRHLFTIPLTVLVSPPIEGYSARSSAPLKGMTDFESLKNRTDSAGRPLDLRTHAHTVSFTQEQLELLATGRHVTIDLAKFGHSFYFVADDRTLLAIKEARR